MGVWYRRYHNIPEGASSLRAGVIPILGTGCPEMLASRKLVCRETSNEGSETAKPGSNEQSLSRPSGKLDTEASQSG